jgi:hypothetical protein
VNEGEKYARLWAAFLELSCCPYCEGIGDLCAGHTPSEYDCSQIADGEIDEPLELCQGKVTKTDGRWTCGDCAYDYGGESAPDFSEL